LDADAVLENILALFAILPLTPVRPVVPLLNPLAVWIDAADGDLPGFLTDGGTGGATRGTNKLAFGTTASTTALHQCDALLLLSLILLKVFSRVKLTAGWRGKLRVPYDFCTANSEKMTTNTVITTTTTTKVQDGLHPHMASIIIDGSD